MKYEELLNISGHIPKGKNLKKKHLRVHDWFPGGDAPKEFIQAYFYKKGEIRANEWRYYIAKVGHKHYPIESITEHLLTELGFIFDMDMAKSELAFILYSSKTQLRYLSQYFLNLHTEQLINGADIYAAYLGDDDIIKEIEAAKKEGDMITVKEAKLAINYLFPNNPEIFIAYIRLLLFGALVGNNDRHFYNWGCIKSLSSDDIHFSPIYDTARRLLWNISDSEILKWYNDPLLKKEKLAKYTRNSTPKVGWDGKQKVNHFELVNLNYNND
jgi:hypothetical protein